MFRSGFRSILSSKTIQIYGQCLLIFRSAKRSVSSLLGSGGIGGFILTFPVPIHDFTAIQFQHDSLPELSIDPGTAPYGPQLLYHGKHLFEIGAPPGPKHGKLAEAPLAVGDTQRQGYGVRHKGHRAELVVFDYVENAIGGM
jgi:hypothetical protein